MTSTKVIPINAMRADTPEAVDEWQGRLERSGFMAVMQVGEPRLSELVAKYKAKGYDVEVTPFVIEDAGSGSSSGSGGGCGSASSCGSKASSSGCGSGGCGTGAPTAASATAPSVPRTIVPGAGVIYVRMRA